jgi:hypothetical protein
MTSRRASLSVGITAAAVGALALAPGAPAAPLPHKEKDYSTHGYQHGVSVQMITSATNGRRIEAGTAPIGSQYAAGGIYVKCPHVTKTGPFEPFMLVPYPAITMKLSHGHYGFSKKISERTNVLSSSAPASTVKVTFTGSVRSASEIAGTVTITGGVCATKAAYTARLTAEKVAPGK